jgi:hypothetical protein
MKNLLLRQIIRTTIVKEVSLLYSMGTDIMEGRIRKKVAKIAKEQEIVLIQQTGIESSLDDSEIRQYVDAVILEVKSSKVPKQSHGLATGFVSILGKKTHVILSK